jgi:hypothetical protein
MAGKVKPGGIRKRHMDVPTRETGSQQLEKNEPVTSNHSATPETMQAVVRVAEELHFVHFYLACGHMITVNKHDARNKHPELMECWACSQG